MQLWVQHWCTGCLAPVQRCAAGALVPVQRTGSREGRKGGWMNQEYSIRRQKNTMHTACVDGVNWLGPIISPAWL